MRHGTTPPGPAFCVWGVMLALLPAFALAAEDEAPLPDSRLGYRTAPLLLLSRPDVRADLAMNADQASSAQKAIRSIYLQAAALKGKPNDEATIRAQAEDELELRRALVTIFLTTSSVEILAERLKKRGADAEAVVQKRLAVARQEIAQWKNFDYLLISGTKQEDLRRTLAIIEAEKLRVARSSAPEF